MTITLEKIDMLMERANISYKEAKEALERNDGDLVEALIELESKEKIGQSQKNDYTKDRAYSDQRKSDKGTSKDHFEGFINGMKKVIAKMNQTSFVLSDKSRTYLDIPFTIAAIAVLVTLPFSLFLLIIPYCFGIKIAILDKNGEEEKVEDLFDYEVSSTKEEGIK